MNEAMEDNIKMIELLLERAIDYGKTSFELVKLKTLDKTADLASSLIPHTVIFVLIASFLFFLNLGLAFWLGEILGQIYLGFFAVGAFYGFMALVFYLFMRKWLKKTIRNYFIKKVLK
jgi:hypothetical protein